MSHKYKLFLAGNYDHVTSVTLSVNLLLLLKLICPSPSIDYTKIAHTLPLYTINYQNKLHADLIVQLLHEHNHTNPDISQSLSSV